MGLNDTPSGERLHIGLFGRRNAGKSSIVNAVTGQDLAIVSSAKGTTTDPVYKAMELLPLGPVMMIDTPGFDDSGALGELRIRKTRQVLNKTDIAILVVDAAEGLCTADKELLALFKTRALPWLIVWNKCDLMPDFSTSTPNEILVSALKQENIYELKERIGQLAPEENNRHLLRDKLQPGEFILLVVPIDSAAPKGRLILPQQQVIREIIDAGAMAVITRESELALTLAKLGQKPALVICDSQVFQRVDKETPADILLTSFSILMARYKGFLAQAVHGVHAVDQLQDGDTILIAEGCTHHRQCDDIGTVKIPRWLHQYTGRQLQIKTCSGTEFPEDLSPYALIIHCGGCMLNPREIAYRMKCAAMQQIPITNYGTFIAYTHGILKRSLQIFPELIQTPASL